MRRSASDSGRAWARATHSVSSSPGLPTPLWRTPPGVRMGNPNLRSWVRSEGHVVRGSWLPTPLWRTPPGVRMVGLDQAVAAHAPVAHASRRANGQPGPEVVGAFRGSRRAWVGAAHSPSPDVRCAHPGLRSLRVRGASASCLRLLPQPGSRGVGSPFLKLVFCRSVAWRRHDVQSMKPLSSSLRAGACSLRTALASICRMRSRVTLKMCPTSSSV